MKRFLIVPSSLNREKSGFPTIKRNTWSFKRLFEHGGRGRDGRSLWKHESSGYDSIKAARLCTFPVILSKLAAKVIGKRQRGEREGEGGRESAHPSHKEPSLRRKYSEFCISNPFARAKQPAETSFSKEAPLTFKWLLPAKQCRNFLSVFHISSAIPPSTPHLLLRQLFPRTTLSLSFSSLRAHCPEKSRSSSFVPPPRHGISVSSRNLLILDESCCSRPLPPRL